MKSKYGHHDDTYRLPKRRRDALSAYGLIGLSEQSDDGVAKFVQSTGPGRACVLIQCQRGQHARGLMFQRVDVKADHLAWASCPTRRRKATGILSWLPLRARPRPTRAIRHAPPTGGRAWRASPRWSG
jgi:hypothetical protein